MTKIKGFYFVHCYEIGVGREEKHPWQKWPTIIVCLICRSEVSRVSTINDVNWIALCGCYFSTTTYFVYNICLVLMPKQRKWKKH